MKLAWEQVDYYGAVCWRAFVRAKDHDGDRTWEILLQPRAGYCDRGRWLANVYADQTPVLDGQEGFPRYYFDLDRAKAELEAWAGARAAIVKVPEP